MARVNIGVDPKLLTDQWLIAESVEITMITGGLRKNNYEIKSPIPESFKLGTGMINFFKNKLDYLINRLEVVNEEMVRRGFKPGTSYKDILGFPEHLYNDWAPTKDESDILRSRLAWKLDNRETLDYWRYEGKYIGAENIESFKQRMLDSELYPL